MEVFAYGRGQSPRHSALGSVFPRLNVETSMQVNCDSVQGKSRVGTFPFTIDTHAWSLMALKDGKVPLVFTKLSICMLHGYI